MATSIEPQLSPTQLLSSSPLHVSTAKHTTKRNNNKNKKQKQTNLNFSPYIWKVLKLQREQADHGISVKAMHIVNCFINDIMIRISGEARQLCKSPSLNSRHIQTACRSLLPGELAKHAVSEGTKAVIRYTDHKSVVGAKHQSLNLSQRE